jgi:hypothetical protein
MIEVIELCLRDRLENQSGQINAHDVGLLVNHMVEETGVLMRKAIVILLPDMRGEQIIQRSNFPAPGQFQRHLQPFRRFDAINANLIMKTKIKQTKTSLV